MDGLTCYRQLIKRYLMEHARLMWEQPVEGLETFCILDEQMDQYLLLTVGWERGRRNNYTTLHVRIKDGKIWVEEDCTEESIAAELVEAGVPKSDIVLAFNPPEMRHLTEFAVV